MWRLFIIYEYIFFGSLISREAFVESFRSCNFDSEKKSIRKRKKKAFFTKTRYSPLVPFACPTTAAAAARDDDTIVSYCDRIALFIKCPFFGRAEKKRCIYITLYTYEKKKKKADRSLESNNSWAAAAPTNAVSE